MKTINLHLQEATNSKDKHKRSILRQVMVKLFKAKEKENLQRRKGVDSLHVGNKNIFIKNKNKEIEVDTNKWKDSRKKKKEYI